MYVSVFDSCVGYGAVQGTGAGFITDKSMQVWTFILSDAKFKTNFTNSAGPTAHAPEVTVDKVQIVCVDAKMFDAEAGS